MKKCEIESFLKSFFIFLFLFEILLSINFWYEFQERKSGINKKIETEMMLCAYTEQCDGLYKNFLKDHTKQKAGILCRDGDFYSYFKVPQSDDAMAKVVYPESFYHKRVEKLKESMIQEFQIYSIGSLLISIFFALYALLPIRQALHINEEFIRDILHDFNTPISSMRINLKLLKKQTGESEKIARLENNIETILLLQHNLQHFIKEIPTQSESFKLQKMVENRVRYFETLYPDVSYIVAIERQFSVQTNKDAFVRILDNLLGNAGKYNVPNGKVFIGLDTKTLLIRDTGKGIKKPSKAFNRYYKEQNRGIGIGLHIVKKLCDELHIVVKLKSKEGKGTTVTLNLSKVTG